MQFGVELVEEGDSEVVAGRENFVCDSLSLVGLRQEQSLAAGNP